VEKSFHWLIPDGRLLSEYKQLLDIISVKAKDSHYFSFKFLASLTEWYPEIFKHAVKNCCHFQPSTFVNPDLHNKL
jgi:hypothetical protein